MALHLVKKNHTVTLVPRALSEALDIATSRENKVYLPGFTLPQDLQIASELKPALMEAEVIIIACPSKFLRAVCGEIRAELSGAHEIKAILTLCKGLEDETNLLPVQVMQEELPGYVHGVLSGPTFASQVAGGQVSAIVLATDGSEAINALLQEEISNDFLRVYASSDTIGVELGGCLKNVYAVATGICDGLGLRDNSRAALLTRALNEMVKVGLALGGQKETFFGLSGLGDLVLTCNGKESRNRTFGEAFAQGVSIEELLVERKMTVEGYRAAKCFHEICEQEGIDAPILEQIYQILYEGQAVTDAIAALMGRSLKREGV